LLRYTCLLSCPFGHPSIVFRARSLHKLTNLAGFVENTKFVLYSEKVGCIEDYHLWLRLMNYSKDPKDVPILKLSNLSMVLVKHRKHSKNASSIGYNAATEIEQKVKTEILKKLVEGVEIDEDLVHEFIKITGRNLSDDKLYAKVMGSLKHRERLLSLFDALIKVFGRMDLANESKQWILKDLQKRRDEVILMSMRQPDADPIDMVQKLM